MSTKLHSVERRGRVKRRLRRRLQIETLEPRNLLAGLVMTDEEQLVIELINRAREAPAAEAARLGVGLNEGLPAGTISSAPKPPLAPKQVPVNVAVAHTLDMLNRNYFSHTNPEGKNAGARLIAAGYPWIAWGENIAWGTHLDAEGFHDLLFRSAGHRKNILKERYREVGVGIRRGNVLKGTELFADTWGDAYITGVAFTDRVVRDNFFSIGEGSGDLKITATPSGGGAAYTTTTGSTGGYALRVPPGTYTVSADRADLADPIVVSGVVIASDNAKVDFIVSPGSIAPDRYESNDAFTSAADLGTDDQSVQHLSIHAASDQDYFRWQSPGTGQLTVQIDLQRRERNLDLLLYDANRNQIASSSGTNTVETVTSSVTAGATYFVRVSGFNRATHADYDLLIDGPVRTGLPPVAESDRYMTQKSQTVTVDVLANDSDDGSLNPSTVAIVSVPEHGEVSVHATTGAITYSSDGEFVGVDKFTYVVQDDEGLVSEEAQVAVSVLDLQRAPWQNPSDPFDINCDDFVSAVDALVLINDINQTQARALPVPSPEVGFPPLFLDSTGDGDLTARDVLRVINVINANATGGGEGESDYDESSAIDMALTSLQYESATGSSLVDPPAERAAPSAGDQALNAASDPFLSAFSDGLSQTWSIRRILTLREPHRSASLQQEVFSRRPATDSGEMTRLQHARQDLEQTLDLLAVDLIGPGSSFV